MKNKKLLKIVTAAMFAALITGLTFFPKIPVPGGGYAHTGDAMIYIAASFLPLPYAMAASATGGLLADILSGYASYAPFTFVIKALLTVSFSSKGSKILTKRNALAPLAGLIITPGLYFVADAVLYGIGGAVQSIVWNVAQAVASIIVFYIIGAAADKAGLKSKLSQKFN